MAASRLGSPIQFMMEKSTMTLFCNVTFDGGVPNLVPLNSKGVANFWKETVPFTGGVVNSTTNIGSISTFFGLYPGMTVSGSGVATSNVISSAQGATTSLTMTKQNITSADGVSLFASGGRYRIQFGKSIGSNSAALPLDTYVKLLSVRYSWDMTSASASGTVNSIAVAPTAPTVFVVGSTAFNNVTIPKTAVAGSTDASIVLQMGFGQGTSFRAFDPVGGEMLRLTFVLGMSSAI